MHIDWQQYHHEGWGKCSLVEMTAMENYSNMQLFFFSHTSPLQQSRHKIPTSFLSFPLKKVFLLYVCKLTSKRRPLCQGVRAVSEILTPSDC